MTSHIPGFQKIQSGIKCAIKDISLKSGLYDGLFFGVYPYMFEPHQLLRLTEYVKSAGSVPGSFVEAGCAHGATTVFLNKFMKAEGIQRDYYAIDTFSGFVQEDMEYEITNRSKSSHISDYFTENKKSWFDKSMLLHGVNGVRSIEGDITKIDFSAIGPIAFCLLDVDLYKPINTVLPKLYDAMSPGGIIIVDDCQPEQLWDGALQAYNEFIQLNGHPQNIVAGKLGIIIAGDLR